MARPSSRHCLVLRGFAVAPQQGHYRGTASPRGEYGSPKVPPPSRAPQFCSRTPVCDQSAAPGKAFAQRCASSPRQSIRSALRAQPSANLPTLPLHIRGSFWYTLSHDTFSRQQHSSGQATRDAQSSGFGLWPGFLPHHRFRPGCQVGEDICSSTRWRSCDRVVFLV